MANIGVIFEVISVRVRRNIEVDDPLSVTLCFVDGDFFCEALRNTISCTVKLVRATMVMK